MPDWTLLKQSHEDKFLEIGYYLGLQFNTGWVISRILGREWANLRPYSVGSVSADGHLTAWNEIKDATDKHYLESAKRSLFYHTFWGINTPLARVYVRYPTKSDIGTLTTTTREIDGDVGYVPGEDSPYEGPFSVKTELITCYERYPAFQVSNVTSDAFANVMFNFDTMKYSYQLIKDKKLIEELLTGKRQCKKYTMGPIDPVPTTCPRWLEDLVTPELIKWTQDLMGSEGLPETSSSERGRGIRREDVERAAVHFGIPASQVTSQMVAALGPRGTGLETGRARR